MHYIEDESFARHLQTELHAYENFKWQKENIEKENLNPTDSKLEYVDPTPSIHDLFVKFDKKFFWSSLGMVQVLWSYKMTKCAGMCSFEGGKGLCKISLSAPLLSLRPRKDLVETLLHEMIHAYLFVTHNYKDREDHGPEFHKHMFRINKEAGTNITVYHTFYDEVEYYQRHIWHCNGPCQKKKPYFGFVRRAINRPPGPHDTWWNQHEQECGGTYIKISEPEPNSKKTKKTKVVNANNKNKDIRDFFINKKTSVTSTKSSNDKSSNIKTFSDFKDTKPIYGGNTKAGTSTIVITNNNKGKTSKIKSSKHQNSTKESTKSENKSPNLKETGSTNILSTGISHVNRSKDCEESCKKDLESDKVRETVRKFWASKFSESKSQEKNHFDKPNSKKVKLVCPVCDKGYSQNEIQKHMENCGQNQSNAKKDIKNLNTETSSSEKTDEVKQCPVCGKDVLQVEINDHIENCLSCSFENESDSDFNNEIVCESLPCPCCYKWFQESEMNIHIDECLTLYTLKEEILVS